MNTDLTRFRGSLIKRDALKQYLEGGREEATLLLERDGCGDGLTVQVSGIVRPGYYPDDEARVEKLEAVVVEDCGDYRQGQVVELAASEAEEAEELLIKTAFNA